MQTKPFNPPDIAKANLANLWWENKNREKFIPTENQIVELINPDPKQWPYAYSRFPTQIVTTCYRRREHDGGYGSNDVLFRSNSGCSSELVLALCRNLDPDNAKPQTLSNALIIASTACERCMNIMAFECGLEWGYPANSDSARKAGTSCELCR
jgi:hypothetical protein